MIANRNSRGLTILELLVTISVIGLLMGLLLPAISAAREASRRTQCTNQLRQTGLALHAHHGARQKLPPGWRRDADADSAYGWVVQLLPFLEERSAQQSVRQNRPITSDSNEASRHTALAQLVCPSDITAPTFELYHSNEDDEVIETITELPTASYLGVFGTIDPWEEGVQPARADGAFGETNAVAFRQFRRGLSKTIIVGERTMARLPSSWMGVDFRGDEPPCRLIGVAQTAPNSYEGLYDDDGDWEECEFDSRHPGGANFLWADGHVSLVADDIDPHEYRSLACLDAPQLDLPAKSYGAAAARESGE